MIAFMIVLGYGIKEDIQYDRSFFTSGLHYGNIFKEFQKDERVMLNKRRLKYEDITSVLNYYQSLVLTETNEICPPKTDQDESLAYCMKKYAKLYNAIDAIPFYMAITFGFLGALIFCLSDLVKRFNMVDLYPKNFVFYSIRFLVAASLCATLANFFLEGFPVIMAMPIFFLIGYFPERAIKYLDQKMTDYLGFKTYKPISLSLVQGMSVEKAFRLREIGIEDVQHLAVTNVNYLKKNLPYNRNMLCDWINQSLLILYFSKQIEALRDAGVRTILDLQNCLLASPENEIKECAKKVGISAIKLQHVKKILETHSMRARIDDLKICLEKACEVEPEKIS